jgi:hypothetical protein
MSVQVNFSRPAALIPPGRTALYAATGSGTLNIYIGDDGSSSVVVYIEMDNSISDPIPGNVGTNGYITLSFNNYLIIYADNLSYAQELAPSVVVTGAVTPPTPTTTAQEATAAFFGFDMSAMFNMLFQFMFLMLFVKMFSTIGQTLGRG